MSNYINEIIEEHEELLQKYLRRSKVDMLYHVSYALERDYTFGFDWINIFFCDKFSAVCFLLKHKEQCIPV